MTNSKPIHTSSGHQLIETGEQLREWQHRLGWTGRRCADELHITEAYFSKLKHNKVAAGISHRIALSCAQLEQIYGRPAANQAETTMARVSAR